MTDPNLQQDVYEKIQEGLKAARAELDTPLLFGHLCKGNMEKLGAVRVSAVVTDNREIPVLHDIPTPYAHDTAFLRHVQRFGREKTLLNWLVYWTRNKMATRERSDSNVSFTASFLLKEQDALISHESDDTSISVTFNYTLLHSLAPAQLASNYLRILYQSNEEYEKSNQLNGHCGRRLDEMALLAAQHHILKSIKTCHDSKRSLLALCSNYDSYGAGGPTETAQELLMLSLLSALQTAFLYAHVFNDKDFGAGGFVCAGLPHRDSFRNVKNPLETVPLWVVSSGTTDPTTVQQYKRVLLESGNKNPVAAAVSLLASAGGAAPGIGQVVCGKTRFSSKSVSLLFRRIHEHVPNPPFPKWCGNAGAWIAHLVSSLHGAKHEGRPLEFIFVIGDMAQIKDSSAFELLHLDRAGFEFPPRSGNEDEVEMLDLLKKAKRTIEKENYCWFQGGRYALLWDFSFPDRKPRYLVGLKDSSWHVFIANARNRCPAETARAACVVGYLDDRGGGGIIVHGEHSFSLAKNGEWIQRGEDLSKYIEDYLVAAGESIVSTNSERATLVRALVAVSNDPDTGCMLVLANGKKIPTFQPMGDPWRVKQETFSDQSEASSYPVVELRDQELVALLCTDGAAVVWREDDSCRIAFRRLASPSAKKRREVAEEAHARLSGEGSRKWSALLTATRRDVNLIIAVSQDGPVHFYCPVKFAKSVSVEDFGGQSDDVVVHDEWPK